MNSYLEHSQQRVKQFKIALKSIKKSDYSSTHSFIMKCNELLLNYREEFTQLVNNKVFGEIDIDDYLSCLNEYSKAQLFLEEYLKNH